MERDEVLKRFEVVREKFRQLEKQANDLLQGYQQGKRNFRGINLNGWRNLRGVNLSGADLSEANLVSVDLTDAILTDANLEKADLHYAHLSNADLSGANLTRANLSYTILTRANLAGAILTDANLEEACLSGCIMPDGILDNASERIINKLGHLKRPAWKPVVQEREGDLKQSKFGGKPWLNADETWPVCLGCTHQMQFFFQLNLDSLPKELNQKFGTGILQFFQCTNESEIELDSWISPSTKTIDSQGNVKYTRRECIEGMDWDPFSKGRLVRIIQADDMSYDLAALKIKEFSPKLIVDWQKVEDYPYGDEIEQKGVKLSRGDVYFMQDTGMYPSGDKLAGWPNWIQFEQYPPCPICGQKMEELIFQLDSYDGVSYLWGDSGTGYIVQCPDHKEQVTFFYQCS